MRLTESAQMLVAVWGVVLASAAVASHAALGDLRRLGPSSKAGSWIWASSMIPGCVLFVEFTCRYVIDGGAIRVPEDLRTIAIAFFGTIAGLFCVGVGVVLREEKGSLRVVVARLGWTLAWAMSGLLSFSMAASV